MSTQDVPESRPGPRSLPGREVDLAELLTLVARGDEAAFEAAYDRLARPVYGLIRKVVRDPAQSQEVAQEVLLEVWRTASRFDVGRRHQPSHHQADRGHAPVGSALARGPACRAGARWR